MTRRLVPVFALLLAVSSAGCTSRDERAATAAGIAADALQQGNLSAARTQIGRALAARDDVGDYWMLSGRIAMAEGNFQGGFDAFEAALTLDRGNLEALTRLCQIAVNSGQAERAERYADQLVALQPGDKAAINVQAVIALDRGDKAGAVKLLNGILVADPHDAAALVTKSRLLAANDDYAGAARLAEASLAAPGSPTGRLLVLKELYRKGADAGGYRRTIARLAQASPASVSAQMDQARSLFDAGETTGGYAATRRILALRPGDIAVAGGVLHLWLAQIGTKTGQAGTGAPGGAMPVDAIAADGATGPIETRATFAAYANAIGRPDLALRALGGGAVPPGTAGADAGAARASALLLLGRRDAAAAMTDAVLATDPDQPRALAVRASLRAGAGNRTGAVEDLRRVLAADPADADARLALADLQLAGGDGVLAVTTLQDGLGDEPGADPRVAVRLAAMLRSQGHAAEGAATLADYARTNPFGPRPHG